MRALAVLLVGASIAVASCCGGGRSSAADEAAIRKIDAGIVAAANAHNVEAVLSFAAPDARLLPPGAPPVVGKDAIRSLLLGFLSPDFHVAHDLERVVVSQGGDLAYVSYTYALTFKGPGGAPVTEKGKDISIYAKAPDGSWKLAVDIWNESGPPPAN